MIAEVVTVLANAVPKPFEPFPKEWAFGIVAYAGAWFALAMWILSMRRKPPLAG